MLTLPHRGLRSVVGSSVLAFGLLCLDARPAHAVLTGQEALKTAEGIQKAFNFVTGVGDLINPHPDLALLIAQMKADIIDELHAIRDDEVEAHARGFLDRFQELSGNPIQDWSQSSNETFYSDSLTVIEAMKKVLLKRRTREDLPSVYNLAQTFNLVVAARVVAMSNAGQICRDPSDPFDDRRPCTPFNQSAFDEVLTEAAEVNHALVGAIQLHLDHPFCLFSSCTSEVSTVRGSSMWQKFSDYWFRIPNQPFVFCACNVWAHRCAPLGDVEGYCTSDWTFLLPQEAAKIESVFNADPVVTTVRIALQGLVDGGFGHVGQGLFAGMIEQVF